LQQIHPVCAKLYFTKTLQEWVAGLDLRAFFLKKRRRAFGAWNDDRFDGAATYKRGELR
jgi:hypothetical protein